MGAPKGDPPLPISPLPSAVYHPLNGSSNEEDDTDENDENEVRYEHVQQRHDAWNKRDALSMLSMHEEDEEERLAAQRGEEHDNHLPHQQHQQDRTVALVLLSLCTILIFADQNLMAPNLTAMAHDFGFTDIERDYKLGGDIAVAFFLLGAPASLLIGMYADYTTHRVRLFAVTILCGEGACVATYFVSTYAQLFGCRALTGISIGGALPLVYSLLGDWFAAPQRHLASSYVGIGMGVGISLGQGVAGFVGPTYGWRLPFVLIGAPAMIVAVVLAMCVSDPPRGGMEAAVQSQHSQNQHTHSAGLVATSTTARAPYSDNDCGNKTTKESLSVSLELSPLGRHGGDYARTMSDNGLNGNNDDGHQPLSRRRKQHAQYINHDLNLQHGDSQPQSHDAAFSSCKDLQHLAAPCRRLVSTPTVLLALLQGAPGCVPWGIVNTYLTDYLAVDRGLTVERATSILLLFGFGNFLGMLLGGHGGAALYTRYSPRHPALLAGGMAMLGCIPFWMMINAIDATTGLVLVVAPIAIFAGLCSGVTGPIIKATLQNVTLPHTRGLAFALFNTFDDFGRGLGPALVAYLIRRLGGRQVAFNVGVLGWMVCGAVNLCVFWTVERDERRVQAQLAASFGGETEASSSSPLPLSEQQGYVPSGLNPDRMMDARTAAPPPADLMQPALDQEGVLT